MTAKTLSDGLIRAWPRGTATGLGSLPGSDPGEAARTVFGEFPDLPHLVELPARGPGSDLIGRTTPLLVDLPVQIEPSGWRFAGRPGLDLRRARDFLARDIDAMEEAAQLWTGAIKIQVAGPLTLAASIELANGHSSVSDPGAVREIAESLREGLSLQLANLASRLPNATFILQVDEPSIPAVLAAEIPTPSGYGTLRAVSAEVVEQRLATVLAAASAGRRVVHCCAARAPIDLFRKAGADAVAIDLALLEKSELDALGEAIDAGMSAWLGVVPTSGPLPTSAQAAERVTRLWDRLAFDPELIADTVVVTPACGLAAATPAYARAAITVAREAARRLADK